MCDDFSKLGERNWRFNIRVRYWALAWRFIFFLRIFYPTPIAYRSSIILNLKHTLKIIEFYTLCQYIWLAQPSSIISSITFSDLRNSINPQIEIFLCCTVFFKLSVFSEVLLSWKTFVNTFDEWIHWVSCSCEEIMKKVEIMFFLG